MKHIDKAIHRIKRACNLILNDGMPDHKYQYKDIEARGTVEKAWKEVGRAMSKVIYGKKVRTK